jgi:hypothetical protein
MKKILLFIPLLSILFFVSCRKENADTKTKVVQSSDISTNKDGDSVTSIDTTTSDVSSDTSTNTSTSTSISTSESGVYDDSLPWGSLH